MSIKAIANGETFNNVSKVTATDGVNTMEVLLSEVGTVPTPTGIKQITENGTFDVSAFAQAVVEVASSGGNARILTGSGSLGTSGITVINHNAGKVPKMFALVCDPDMELGVNRTSGAVYIDGLGSVNMLSSATNFWNSAYSQIYGDAAVVDDSVAGSKTASGLNGFVVSENYARLKRSLNGSIDTLFTWIAVVEE